MSKITLAPVTHGKYFFIPEKERCDDLIATIANRLPYDLKVGINCNLITKKPNEILRREFNELLLVIIEDYSVGDIVTYFKPDFLIVRSHEQPVGISFDHIILKHYDSRYIDNERQFNLLLQVSKCYITTELKYILPSDRVINI